VSPWRHLKELTGNSCDGRPKNADRIIVVGLPSRRMTSRLSVLEWGLRFHVNKEAATMPCIEQASAL
jgi:hypothetical protein